MKGGWYARSEAHWSFRDSSGRTVGSLIKVEPKLSAYARSAWPDEPPPRPYWLVMPAGEKPLGCPFYDIKRAANMFRGMS